MPRQNSFKAKRLAELLPSADLSSSVANVEVFGLTIDSRQVEQGFIFVAVQGLTSHGESYIDQAIASGAVAVFKEAAEKNISVSLYNAVPIISIPQLEISLSDIAGQFYGDSTKEIPVVGFTGTNGKTTCTQLYAQLSAMLGNTSAVLGTLGYGLYRFKDDRPDLSLQSTGMTTPDAISTQAICATLIKEGADDIAMEVSSHGLEQGRVAAINIDTAVFTNLTHDHLDYHGTMEAYALAKAKLFSMASITSAVLNGDDAYSRQFIEHIGNKVKVVTYSIDNPEADIFLTDCEYRSTTISARLHTPEGSYDFNTSLVGQFNLSNLLAVLGVFYINGQSFQEAITLIEKIRPVPGRMELIPNQLDKQVVIDYAHTPDALENALRALRFQLKTISKTIANEEMPDKKLWCVFGCGGDRDKEKRPLMASVAERYADRVVVTNDNPRNENPHMIADHICEGFQDNKHHVILDRQQAIESALTESKAGDIILIAGKGHEDYQLIGGEVLSFSDQKVARLIMRVLEDGMTDSKNRNENEEEGSDQ